MFLSGDVRDLSPPTALPIPTSPIRSCVTIALPFARDCPRFAAVIVYILLRVLVLRSQYPMSFGNPYNIYGDVARMSVSIIGGSRYLIYQLYARHSTNALIYCVALLT